MKINFFKDYYSYSKNILVSLIFLSPFLFLYEFICFMYFRNSNYQIRNSADIILRNIFDLFGSYSELLYSISLFVIIVFIYFINKKKGSQLNVKIQYLIFIFIEGLLYGLLLLILINNFSIFDFNKNIYQPNLLLNLYLCIGAGIWEEILFRLIVFSFLYNLFNKYFSGISVFLISVIASSILFSLFHYIGSSAEIFNIYTFNLRFLGGVFLCILYYFRGFAVVSMAHISYDFILVSLPLIYT